MPPPPTSLHRSATTSDRGRLNSEGGSGRTPRLGPRGRAQRSAARRAKGRGIRARNSWETESSTLSGMGSTGRRCSATAHCSARTSPASSRSMVGASLRPTQRGRASSLHGLRGHVLPSFVKVDGSSAVRRRCERGQRRACPHHHHYRSARFDHRLGSLWSTSGSARGAGRAAPIIFAFWASHCKL